MSDRLRRAAAVAAALFILLAAIPTYAAYTPSELPIALRWYDDQGEQIQISTEQVRYSNWRTNLADVTFHVPAYITFNGKTYLTKTVMGWNEYNQQQVDIGVVPSKSNTMWLYQKFSVSGGHTFNGNLMEWLVELAYYNNSLSVPNTYIAMYVELKEVTVADIAEILEQGTPMPEGYSETLAEIARQNTTTDRVIGEASALDPTPAEKQAALNSAISSTVGSLSQGDVATISQIAGAAFLQNTPFYGIILLFLVAIVAALILKGAKGS